jgi:hypothetical protein
MHSRRLTLAVAAGVVLLACAELTGPPATRPRPPNAVSEAQLHHLQWRASQPQFLLGPAQGTFAVTASPTAEPPQLAEYEASFTAVKGEAGSLRIDYRSTDGQSLPFLLFSLGRESLAALPDGTPLNQGDAVRISVAIDTSKFVIRFLPKGLTLSEADPARLQIWYTGADQDLDGDGYVDAHDSYIESELLGLWRQQLDTEYWTQTDATQSTTEKEFSGGVINLSGYAVSY